MGLSELRSASERCAARDAARKAKLAKKFCTAPDRDVPALTCGFPLPCPYHTSSGARIVRVVALIEKPEQLRGRNRSGRIFGIPLGRKWEAVCEQYLASAVHFLVGPALRLRLNIFLPERIPRR